MKDLLVPCGQSISIRPGGQFYFDPDESDAAILPAMTAGKWVPSEDQLKAFGARLAAARKAKGLTLDDIGARFGYGSGKGAPWTWEKGSVQPPVLLLAELAKLYGTTIDYLVTGREVGAWPFPSVPPSKFFSLSGEIREHTERSLAAAVSAGEISPPMDLAIAQGGRR